MSGKTKWLYVSFGALAALGLVLGAGLAVTQAVNAAAAPAPSAGAAMLSWMGRGGPFGGDYEEALAEALGITQDELEDAYVAAREAAIADAVAEDAITQDQADRMLGAGGPGRRGHEFFGAGSAFNEFLADALGISVESLEQAQSDALSAVVAQAVEEGSITQDEAELILARHAIRSYVEEAMTAAYSDAVASAVADGVITQSQADQLLTQSGGMFGGRGFGGPGFGPHR